jgi:hypothetical protein
MNLHTCLKLLAQSLCMLYLYSAQPSTFPLLPVLPSFGLVFWTLYSFKLYELSNMTKITTYLALPALILVCLTALAAALKAILLGQTLPTAWPQNLEIGMAVTFPLYAVFANLKAGRSSLKNPFLQRYEDFLRRNEAYHSHNAFALFVRWAVGKFLYYFKYAMMLLSIFTTMQDISLLNLFLMVFSIICLSMESKVNTHWKRYLFLIDRLILFK